MRKIIAILALNLALVVCLVPTNARAERQHTEENIFPAESPADREARHKEIAVRRQGAVVILHRGAAAFAPENTLEAYAAAVDYGADGCEIDIRRAADGVLVIFHDDGLDRMTDALGRVNQYTYRELTALNFRSIYQAKPGTRIPTLAAVFELARQRRMLLHLDIKDPGLETEIGRMLERADIWDHVVAINDYNSVDLRKNPKFEPLVYKVFGLQEGRFDMDPDKIREALGKPGNMIMVDDPRVAARELKRRFQVAPVPENLRGPSPAPLSSVSHDTNSFSPPQFLRALSNRVDSHSLPELEKLLAADFPARAELDGEAIIQRQRLERILERAWAAQKVCQVGRHSRRVVKLLEHLVENRSLHRDWAYQGLDGVMAVRALGALRATQSVPALTRTFLAVDPELKKLVQPPANYPYAWTDFHLKFEIMTMLGELPCEQSKKFLLDYLAMDKEAAGKYAPPLFEEATRSLLQQELAQNELEDLLRSTNSAIRGTAILECLDHPTTSRRVALKAVLPWTQDLTKHRTSNAQHPTSKDKTKK